jgi:hypothetical protein
MLDCGAPLISGQAGDTDTAMNAQTEQSTHELVRSMAVAP